MDYFSILNLNREPFSNSPDPDYFYQSRQHWDCLQKLELSLHLRRGLNVVIGEVGSGKTTLCRQLLRKFAQRKDMETHLILDPAFRDTGDFLGAVAKLLSGRKPAESVSEWQIKEFIKHSLFRKGVDQKKTVVLIIDEGQKLPEFCLEILREFLNYETNEYKLLQIVLFAQTEFEAAIRRHPNFADRIHLFHRLAPLTFRDTRRMINFRLEKSSSTPRELKLFTLPALWAVFRISGGYPRKIVHLCHHSILAMIVQNSRRITYRTVRRCAERLFPARVRSRKPLAVAATACALLAAAALFTATPWFDFTRLTGARRVIGAEEPAAAPPDQTPERVSPTAAAETPAPPAAAAEAAPAAAAPFVREVSAAAAPVPESAEPAAGPAPEAAPPAAEPAVAAPGAAPAPPPILGRVTLRPSETLSGLMHRVYGNYSNRHFRALILANVHIEDPDRVMAGEPIVLPSVAVPVKPLNKDAWWVKLADAASAQQGLDLLRSIPETAAAVRLVPYWTPKSGLRFAVVMKQVFQTEQEARARLARMPAPFADQGGVQSAWGEHVVFFADPTYVR